MFVERFTTIATNLRNASAAITEANELLTKLQSHIPNEDDIPDKDDFDEYTVRELRRKFEEWAAMLGRFDSIGAQAIKIGEALYV